MSDRSGTVDDDGDGDDVDDDVGNGTTFETLVLAIFLF